MPYFKGQQKQDPENAQWKVLVLMRDHDYMIVFDQNAQKMVYLSHNDRGDQKIKERRREKQKEIQCEI